MYIICLYCTGFDVESGLPVWASYTLLRQSVPLSYNPNISWRLDVRLDENISSICSRERPMGSIVVPLFPFGIN